MTTQLLSAAHVLLSSVPPGVWDKVLGPVAERRTESDTLKLFPVYLKGEDLFGLTISAVTKIAESVRGLIPSRQASTIVEETHRVHTFIEEKSECIIVMQFSFPAARSGSL